MKNFTIISIFYLLFLQTHYSFGQKLMVENIKMYESKDLNLDVKTIIDSNLTAQFCTPAQCDMVAKPQYLYWLYCETSSSQNLQYVFDSQFFYYNVTAYFFNEKMEFVDSVYAGRHSRQDINKDQLSNAIPIPTLPKLKCFIKFQTKMARGIDFTAYNYLEYNQLKLKVYVFNGIIDGIFFLAILYSAIFAILLKKHIYIYYMVYVGSFWVFMQPINQDSTLFFSYFNLPFSESYFTVPSYLLTISLILYTRELLQLKLRLPHFDKITLGVVVILIILLLIYIFFGWTWNEGDWNKVALLPSFVASIILVKKNYKPAWFVFLGISLIYFAYFSIQLELNAYIPVFFTFSFYGIIEVILFGVSITYWLKSLLIENVEVLKLALNTSDEIALIKQNQNVILEKEVEKKTQELKIANQKLEASIEEVNNLNSYLEKDNSLLKVEVIGQLKARTEDKLMSFEEFKMYFPDEEACDAHIEGIKWAKGFVCLKCKGVEYVEKAVLNKKIARRCTQCNFVYTASSYTLFHNLKFPLQKAFYITYVIGTKKSKTLEDFSQELDLRKATVHAFVQKVKEANSAVTKNKHKDGWTHLIEYYKPS